MGVKEIIKDEEEVEEEFASSSHTGIARRPSRANIIVQQNKINKVKFIFPLCQAYHAFKVDMTGYVFHITKESISAANLMLVYIIEQSHWTLLVGNLKIKIWNFYDSLLKKTHRLYPISTTKQEIHLKLTFECGRSDKSNVYQPKRIA
ncbi:hypothetical protein IEQ34_020701 [Dendrobium chrysotoxum]|uniref:Ubiquitin-like protease family profile domain-containing protein n=1 Tax=Dendrobium chrysotoxum TaxID=161865 RepID=A0AAV7G1Q7_DENCH|nr:hypothetical protein IEQ34_020701 [Dendrobium chrysotoxum]